MKDEGKIRVDFDANNIEVAIKGLTEIANFFGSQSRKQGDDSDLMAQFLLQLLPVWVKVFHKALGQQNTPGSALTGLGRAIAVMAALSITTCAPRGKHLKIAEAFGKCMSADIEQLVDAMIKDLPEQDNLACFEEFLHARDLH